MLSQHALLAFASVTVCIAACSPASTQRDVATTPPEAAPVHSQSSTAASPPSDATGVAPAKASPVERAAAAPVPFVTPTSAEIKERGATPAFAPSPLPLLKKKWSTRIGRTTFRTTIAFAENLIVVGTHGASLEGSKEPSDGVYVLEKATGKVARVIATPGNGDRDVGGVAVDQGDVVFSTDNGHVVKAKIDSGALVWSTLVSTTPVSTSPASRIKVRPAPALANLDGKGALDIVVGDEAGELHALDGDTGRRLWVKSTGTNEYDARGFIAAAAIADVNGDRFDDVIAGARDGVLVAYDGRNGDALWQDSGGSGIHASPSVLDVDGDGRLEVLAAWSYSRVALFDAATGLLRYEQRLELDDGGIEGLFSSPIPLPAAGSGFIVQGTAWWGGSRKDKGPLVDGIVFASQAGREFRTNEGPVSASAVVMDLGDDGVWDAVVGTEARELLALSADGRRRVLAKLGGAIEATAAITDVDGDGTFELLVASNDGMLTCFGTDSKTRPLLTRFRGNSSDNRGHLDGLQLRFALSRESGRAAADR